MYDYLECESKCKLIVPCIIKWNLKENTNVIKNVIYHAGEGVFIEDHFHFFRRDFCKNLY